MNSKKGVTLCEALFLCPKLKKENSYATISDMFSVKIQKQILKFFGRTRL